MAGIKINLKSKCLFKEKGRNKFSLEYILYLL